MEFILMKTQVFEEKSICNCHKPAIPPKIKSSGEHND